jgi:RNA polymerase sigma-70 factor, ECF subfamily
MVTAKAHAGRNMAAKVFLSSPSALATASSADLVARAQRGEEAAFAALFEAHKRRVYSLCLRMTGISSEAEDLTQRVFLQVFREIAAFRGESTFSNRLHRLTIHEVLTHLRKRRLEERSFGEVHTSTVKAG